MPTVTPQEYTCVRCEETFSANPTQAEVDYETEIGKTPRPTTLGFRCECTLCGFEQKQIYDIPQE